MDGRGGVSAPLWSRHSCLLAQKKLCAKLFDETGCFAYNPSHYGTTTQTT